MEPPRGGRLRPGLALTALILTVASFQLNATMLSPAIGDMAERLNTSTGVIGWSSTVFLAVAAALASGFRRGVWVRLRGEMGKCS